MSVFGIRDRLKGIVRGRAEEPPKPAAAPVVKAVEKPSVAPVAVPVAVPGEAQPALAPVEARVAPVEAKVAPVEAKVAPVEAKVVPVEARPSGIAALAAKAAGVTAPVEAPAVVPAAGPVQSVAALAAGAAAAKVGGRMLHADMGSTDVDAYRARAVAAGKDPGLVRGGTGVNRADDGEAFWGPVDNESSRAKAAGKLLTVDQWECISCGTCVEQTDKVFYLPADGKATPIAQDGPMDLIQEALDACPVTCIHWVTPDEASDRGLATGMDEG